LQDSDSTDSVTTRAHEALAVGAKGHAGDRVRVSLEGQNLIARVRVPDFHHALIAAADEALAVGAEGHAGDTARVSLEGENFLARGRIPDPDALNPVAYADAALAV